MGDTTSTAHRGPAVSELHAVSGVFSTPDEMQEAIRRLEQAGFDRADLSVPVAPSEASTPETGAKPADTDDDARQARTLHTSTGASIAALAAAGVTVATGGAAAPALAAAAVAGAVVGGATYAVSSGANQHDQQEREARAASGQLILSVRAATAAKQATAEALLRATGATEVQTQ
jgi:hypothetical protein